MKFIEKLFLKDIRLSTQIILIFFLAIAIIVFLIHGVMVLFFQYPLDYGEGPLLNQALRITQGEPLYPVDIASPPYLVSNYPPVYVLFSAFFVWIFGPSLVIGRLISFLSTIGTAIFIGLIVRLFFPDRNFLPMLSGATVFIIIPYVLEWSALYRIDMLALCFSFAGLYLVLKDPEKNRNIILAAVLFILAAYTRQSFGLAAPLSATIWTWTKNRKQSLRLAASYAVGGLALFGILQLLTNGGFFFHIITANVNPFNWDTVWNFARDILQKIPWLIGLFLLYLVIGWRTTKAYAFLALYLISGIAVALTIGKVGSNINYLVEISAGFALLTGVVMGWLTESFRVPSNERPDLVFSKDEIPEAETVKPGVRRKMWLNLALFAVLAFVLIFQVANLTRASLLGPITSHRNRIKPDKDYIFLEENIKSAAKEGPVLADEFMAVLPKNGIPLYLQPFEMSQLVNAGLWDQSPLIDSLRNRQFPLILIHHFQFYPVYLERWTSEMRLAIFENYVATEMKADSLFFTPKDFENETYPDGLSCPRAPWQLPTAADMGLYWSSGQMLMLGDGLTGEIPVYAIADGLGYQFSEWKTAVAIQHDDPFNPGEFIWSFYGDLAPAYDAQNSYIPEKYQGAEGISVKAGELIGYQGRWLGPDQQTWVHLRFTLLPSDVDGNFPESLLGIGDPFADLPSYKEQTRMGLNAQVSLSRYTGLPESAIFGTLDFLPFTCESGTE